MVPLPPLRAAPNHGVSAEEESPPEAQAGEEGQEGCH